jgi:histidinol phosphatase-like enzyme (inositol monophosphatase family)
MPDLPDFPDLAKFAKELAVISRKIMLDGIARGVDFEIKADGSPVTNIDKKIERALRKHIAQRYPDHGILGEEYANINLNAELVWVIDPIDGTKSFATGVPTFCTLIGLAHKEEFIIGLMDFPVTQEQWIGGRGIRVQCNGKDVQVRNCKTLAKACLSACDPLRENSYEQNGILRLASKSCFNVWGAGSYGFGMILSGKMDIAVECGLDVFDFAAPVAIFEAAGVKATDWNGRPVNMHTQGKLLFAGDARLIDEAVAVLQE